MGSWEAQVAQMVKNLPANSGDASLIPGSGRSSGEGNGTPLQYSCLENPMDRGAWWAIVHGVSQSWIRLKQLHTHAHILKFLIIHSVQMTITSIYLA